MHFFSTFTMGFKYLWKDPITVTILICFPIVIILLLGTALENVFSTEVNLDPAPIAVVAEPHSPLGIFLLNEEVSRFFEPEFTDLERARDLVATGNASAAFVEQSLGRPVKVLLPPHTDIMAQIALTVIDSYQQIGAAGTIAIMSGRDITGLAVWDVEVTPQPLGTRTPGAMDYYAVTMLIMIILFGGLGGMELFHKGLFSETGDRMRLSPINKSSLVGGLMTASAVTGFSKGMIVFVFTIVVYNVYWGSRIPLVIVTLLGVVLFSQALCVLLFIITGKKNAVVAISQTLFFITTFISGGYMPINFDGIIGRATQFMPNALAHTVIFGAIYGGDEAFMATSLAVLFASGIIMMLLSFLLGRRRLA
ncbi:MAG: ABC transporter permease [Defluviitaleaceae bacterium]|nr:ABC transporter permease [Defluviitaleaceae bacterium]